jgi:hypothetical protein
LLGSALLIIAVPSLVGLEGSASTSTPAAVLAAALRDATASKGVHEVLTAKESGLTASRVDDIGTTEGRQVITLSSGATAEVVAFASSKKAYIRANSLGISNYFAFPTKTPAKYANKWLELTPTDANYAAVVSATTLSSDFPQLLQISGPLSFGHVTSLAGVPVTEMLGKIPASSNNPALAVTLYLTSSGKILPLELKEASSGLSAVIKWSKWGTKVILSSPANAEKEPVV